MEAAPKPDGASEATPAKAELPIVESPSISPGTETPAIATDTPALAIEPIVAAEPAVEPMAAPATRPRFVLRPRHRRYALLAASVTFAAALGAVVGALASGGFSTPVPAKPDVAAIEQNKAMQQSIARLGKEITTLKAGLELANKSAHVQLAKISERLDHATAEITGSISAPQTTAPVLTPLPAPRPQPRIAAVEPLRPRACRWCWAGPSTTSATVTSRGKSRRDLSSRARRPAARPRPGAIGQTAGRPLDGADAEGHHRVAARPPLFRRILSVGADRD